MFRNNPNLTADHRARRCKRLYRTDGGYGETGSYIFIPAYSITETGNRLQQCAALVRDTNRHRHNVFSTPIGAHDSPYVTGGVGKITATALA